MKAYYLRFTNDDFIKSGKTWRTPIYDLYYNDQYKNYSVKRANHGTNLLGDGTYTGLNLLSPTTTDIGFVEDGRFIDTSGRIDVLTWRASFTTDLTAAINVAFTAYNTEDPSAGPYYSHATPDLVSDWLSRGPLSPGVPIYFIDANRYSFFELVFETDISDMEDIEVELLIGIEIDPPVVEGYFESTKKILNKFPEWMDIREYDPLDLTTATPATPSSLGGKLINAISGEWLTHINSIIQYQQFQNYIDTTDLDQKAWAYITRRVPTQIREVKGDGIVLACASSINDFFESLSTSDVYFYNQITNELFTNKLYNDLFINQDITVDASTYTYEQEPYQVWNSFDDIGATVDLFRIESATPNGYLEDNDSFRKRILDVYINKPNINIEGFKHALRREFNLWRYWGATPDSQYAGATPEIYEIEDLENDISYFTTAGIPTQKFKDLIEVLANKYPMTWGYFKYGKAFWDADGLTHKGFKALPRQLDATPVDEEYLQSGVGDGNDAYIFKPKAFTGIETFNTNLKLRGRQKTNRSEYLPLAFDVKVYGTAAEDLWDNPVVTGRFTIELTVIDNSASPASPNQTVCYANITVTDQSQISYYDATPSNGSLFDWTTLDGRTDISYQFKDKYTGDSVGQIDLSQVSKVEIKAGHFNGNHATPSYDNATTQSTYKAWFPNVPGTIMGSGGSTQLTINSFDYATNDGSFFFQSQSTSHPAATPNSWTSDSYMYRITLNGVQPDMTVSNFTLDLPYILWPASTSSRSYVVELLTNDGLGNYGVYSDNNAATPIFLPSTYIAVDGNTTWTDDYKKTFSTATSSITFSSVTGSAYPFNANVWTLFSSSVPYVVNGTVDEYGPWRYAQSAKIGNKNFIVESLDLDRDDFGVPNTTDYIITWIGVESVSNSNVISWVETNTVKPAVVDTGETNLEYIYPDNAIEETLNADTGKYEFSTVNVYARLKPGANDKWNPKVHSGWIHDDVEEFYIYADPVREYATVNSKVLGGVNRLGAPVLVKAIPESGSEASPSFDLRQVAFWAESATPSLGLVNTETVFGNGTTKLYAAYKDIYDISVQDLTIGQAVSVVSSTTSTNEITLSANSNKDHEYELSYKAAKSFYVDNAYLLATPNHYRSMVVFDKEPTEYFGIAKYRIDYESSVYDPATPADIPLNTLYTSVDEGFIYIDHDVHELNQIEVKISPSKIVADGIDYAMVTFKAFDVYGNPKPNQSFNIYTNFGTLDRASVTSDKDGFAFAILQSEAWDGSINPSPATPALPAATPGTDNQGLILVDGAVDARLGFEIQIPPQGKYRIVAVLDSDFIIANGASATSIFGLVEDEAHAPVPYAVIYWRKARNSYELFNTSWASTSATPGSINNSGYVVADANGRFSIGPFVSSTVSGYWLAAVESGSASPNMSGNQFDLSGDIVYWYEYPNITNTIDPITQLPIPAVQDATPYWIIPSNNVANSFPATYDESETQPGYNGIRQVVVPPRWVPMPRYSQYQQGLLGSSYHTMSSATPTYPDYEEL
jgi:hypothetical protein